MYYKIYYFNSFDFFCAENPLPKLPSHISLVSNPEMSQIQLNSLYKWSCTLGVKQLSYISDSLPKLPAPIGREKGLILNRVDKKTIRSHIISLCKETGEVNRDSIIQNPSDLNIFIGKSGMQMDGVPLSFLYCSEVYHLDKVNELNFYKVLKRFAESEQRNGR